MRWTAGVPAAEAREGLGADAELIPVCIPGVATIRLQTPRERGRDAVTLRVTTSRAPGSLGTHSLIYSSHRQELLPCARTLLGAGAQQGMVDILGFLVELAF